MDSARCRAAAPMKRCSAHVRRRHVPRVGPRAPRHGARDACASKRAPQQVSLESGHLGSWNRSQSRQQAPA